MDSDQLRTLANDTRLSQRRRPASQRDNDALALANGAIAALDEIARLTVEHNRFLGLLWQIHTNNKRGLPDGVAEQIEMLPYPPPDTKKE